MKVKHLIFPIRNSKIYCATFKLNLQSQLFRIVLIAVKIEIANLKDLATPAHN